MDSAHPTPPALQALFADHDRQWRSFDYVYPVLSRRSGGLSIGINLNPDKVCNFDCIYCSVNRQEPPKRRDVNEDQVLHELEQMLQFVASGEIYQTPEFADVPPAWRRVNDVAFSGDGEPTSYPGFLSVVKRVGQLLATTPLLFQERVEKSTHATPLPSREGVGGGCEHVTTTPKQELHPHPTLPLKGGGVKMVLITNATLLHRPQVQAALKVMDEHNGEVWAKLDAGTAAYYRLVNRTAVQFERVLDNILACAQARPTVIQSLFMTIQSVGPSQAEIAAYCERLEHVVRAGGRIKLVQIYTVARWTTENYVNVLSDKELAAIADRVRQMLPDVPVEIYPGVPIVR